MATLSSQQNFGAFLTPLSPISHPICQQIMLALLSKYPEFGHVSPPWSQTTIFHLDYCTAKTSQLVLSALAPVNIIMQCHLLRWCHSLLRTFQWIPVQSLPSSSVSHSFPISFPTTLPLTESTLGPLTLLFLKHSRDLSTSGLLCLLFPLPHHPMVSPGLVLTLSLDIKSHLLRETFHGLLIYNFKSALVV